MFTNAPFKPKLTTKPQQQRPMATTNKINAISPSSSHSTSSSNSQLIDLTVPTQSTVVDSTIKEQVRPSPPRRAVGSAGLASNFSTFGTINTTNETYYFHSDRVYNDGHSSSEELTSSSSTRKRHSNKKKSSTNNTTGNDSQQHAYANLSFNDAIVDELL